ncbi:MAG: DNA polymerase subunit beta [Planctomycetes bacterium]|nr:DNA polymerase subunit beta [Planctomycetota bacterium]
MIALLEQRQTEIADLCRRYRVRRLEVFGSAAGGPFDETQSDVDFLVEFEEGYPEGPFAQYFDFLAALKTLLGRDVDLVETRAITNPYFLQAVDRTTREVLYAL